MNTKAKKNGRVAVGYAQAQAGAQAPAHAQHTNTRTYNVYLVSRASHKTETRYWRNELIKGATPSTLVRVIAHKHALGYKFDEIFRTEDGTFIVTLAKRTKLELYPSFYAPYVGSNRDCPYRDALRQTREGRE